MSTATLRVPRVVPAPRPAPVAHRPVALRLVPHHPSSAARAPFVVTVVGLLTLGLLGLLAVNTLLDQGSFRLHALSVQASALDDQEQTLTRTVDALQDPAVLAARARALGLVPAGPPAFLRLSDGAILGDPAPAGPSTQPVPDARPTGAPAPAGPSAHPAPAARPTGAPAPAKAQPHAVATSRPPARPHATPAPRPSPPGKR